jgi:hypothetical protein
MWAGIFTRTQKSTPGAFSPFSFSEQTVLSTKSDKDRSLLLEIYSSTKGGLIKSIDDVKSSAKTTVTVPQDFHSLLYQLKAFTFAVGFVFGKDSILATKLLDIVEKVDKTASSTKTELRTKSHSPQKFCGRWTASRSFSSKTVASALTKRMSTRGSSTLMA